MNNGFDFDANIFSNNDIAGEQASAKKLEFERKLGEIEDNIAVGDFEGDGMISGAKEIMVSLINDPEMHDFWIKNARFYYAKLKIAFKISEDKALVTRFDEVCQNPDYKKTRLYAEQTDPALLERLTALESSAEAQMALSLQREAEQRALMEKQLLAEKQARDFYIEDGVLIEYRGTDTAVTVPDGVTRISTDAFTKHSDSLKSIIIPDSVKTIDEYAFYECVALESVHLPSGLANISEWLFYGCHSLKSVNIPEGVKFIDSCAFYNCFCLKSIDLPNTLTEIADYAFSKCGFETITLPNDLKIIGEAAFFECTELKSITVPDSVKIIEAQAFFECTALESIRLPYRMKTVPYMMLCGCTALKKVILPQRLWKIDESAFIGCEMLESIELPDDTERIEEWAFKGCQRLKTVKTSETLVFIGEKAFCETNIGRVKLSKHCTVEKDAFPQDCQIERVDEDDE